MIASDDTSRIAGHSLDRLLRARAAPLPKLHVPLIDLQAQYATIRAEVEPAIGAVLERCDFVLGEAVTRFEESFAAYCQVPHAVGVNSGISALEMVLRAWGVGPGDEVITAANSFIASASAISFTGAAPVLVDVSPDTLLMTPEAVAKAITPRTKAIMPVHLYGQPVDMDPLMAIAEARGLWVVEDACQAHGARYKGRRVGSLGHAAAFSFYPGRNLGANGDGGMLVTKDEALAARIRELRNEGHREKSGHISPTSIRRLDPIQAAVLEVKLRHLDHWNARRVEIAGHYRARLSEMALDIPAIAEHVDSAYHLFVIQVEHRDQVLSLLRKEGIGAGIHYPIPIHRQPAYAHLGQAPGSMPVSEAVAEQLISLPLFPEMTAEQIQYVTATFRSILA